MHIVVFGVNHKTAPIEIREKFYLNPLQQDLFLSELKNNPSIAETFVLSTCNRTEIYLYGMNIQDYLGPLLKLMGDIRKIEFDMDLKKYFYCYENEEAVRHLLRVTSGLDSLVLGEKQIIGQVKAAVERARMKMMFGRYFNILANMAVRTAKKAQTETQISYGGSSVSWAAMAMAEDLLGTLTGKSILIIGAGKMGELTLDQIRNKGVQDIYMMNRTGSAAMALAESCGGIAASFEDIKEILSVVDVCVCSASAPHYILEKKAIEKVMVLRQNRKLIMIDISMPRNIDPQVGQVDQVYLATIDDLDKVVGENMRKRQSAIPVVEAFIEQKLAAYYEKLSKLPDEESFNERVS